MNKKLLTAVVGATLAVAGNAANAIDLKISGHVARAVMWADDGVTSETYHSDVGTSPSRIRFLASDDLAPGVKAGVNWESGFSSNGTGSVTQTARTVAPSFGERWQEIWFSGAFGKVAFGQGEPAAKGVPGADLSGTDLAHGGAPVDIGGGLRFRTAASATPDGPAISSVLANFDTTRYDRIRYDSPALGPVVISASTGYTGQVDTNEFAARLNVDLGGGGKLAGALGFVKSGRGGADLAESTGTQEDTLVSVSWLASFGLNLTVAHSQREDDATLDADFTRFQVGYKAGEHAVSVGYALGKDQALVDDEAEELYVAYNFKPKPWADIFATARTFKLDRPSTSYEDITLVLVGSRIVF